MPQAHGVTQIQGQWPPEVTPHRLLSYSTGPEGRGSGGMGMDKQSTRLRVRPPQGEQTGSG